MSYKFAAKTHLEGKEDPLPTIKAQHYIDGKNFQCILLIFGGLPTMVIGLFSESETDSKNQIQTEMGWLVKLLKLVVLFKHTGKS